MKTWYVYIVECSDRSYYCGITTDIFRRVYEHNFTKKGSKYCKSRRPVEFVWSSYGDTKSKALKLEAYIKKLSKEDKQHLVNSYKNVDIEMKKDAETLDSLLDVGLI